MKKIKKKINKEKGKKLIQLLFIKYNHKMNKNCKIRY